MNRCERCNCSSMDDDLIWNENGEELCSECFAQELENLEDSLVNDSD